MAWILKKFNAPKRKGIKQTRLGKYEELSAEALILLMPSSVVILLPMMLKMSRKLIQI